MIGAKHLRRARAGGPIGRERAAWFRALRAIAFPILVLGAAILSQGPADADIVLTDLKGRTVTLHEKANRIVVDDGRLILALSFLTKDPTSLVAGWPHDVDRFGRELYATYVKQFPTIDSLPRTTSNAQDLQIEQILTIKPDLLVLSLYSHVAEQQIDKLRQIGIPTIFVDFVADPFANTDRSLTVLGQAVGHEAEAEKVVAFRRAQREAIARRIGEAKSKPNVFLESHASTDEPCCNSPGKGNIGRFIDFLSDRNIGDVLGDKPFGQLSLEYVIASNADIYVASGGEYMMKRGGLLIGPHFSKDETAASMTRLLSRPGIAALPAVRNGNVHGLSQQVFNSPLDILALMHLARWTHPDLFADLDVEAARQRLNGFMAVPLIGRYWTD